jgi:hypothetical protein
MRFLYQVIQIPMQTLYEVFSRLNFTQASVKKTGSIQEKHSYSLRPRKPISYAESV